MKLINPKRNRNSQALQHGFTLVELLCVMVILGVLASVVLPRLTGKTEQARIVAAQSQISIFGTALDSFEVDMGYYPKGKNGLADLMVKPRDGQSWRGPYLKQDVPVDPWQHPYIYECPGKRNPMTYDLYSMGPTGRGGDDAIGNWTQAKR